MPALPPEELLGLIDQAARQAASALGEILNSRVEIKFSEVHQLLPEAVCPLLERQVSLPGAAVRLEFFGPACGAAFFIVPAGQLERLIQPVIEQDDSLAGAENYERMILGEIGNVILNVCVGTITNRLNIRSDYKYPEVYTDLPAEDWTGQVGIPAGGQASAALMLSSRLEAGELQLWGYILVTFDEPLAAALASQ